MTDTPNDLYDEVLSNMLKTIDIDDLASDETTKAFVNLERFSKCRPPAPDLNLIPDPIVIPTTRWGKAKAAASGVWDNETTRVFIKAGGAFAGVAVVAWSTIHKDRVLERQALDQARQTRPS